MKLTPAILALAAALSVGCGSAPATLTPSAGTTVTTTTSATPTSVTPTVTTDEDKIRTQIIGYNDFLDRAYSDPSVSVNEAAKYLMNKSPDMVMTAVMQDILKFRDDGYKESGSATVEVRSITKASGGRRNATACVDYSRVVVTDAKGKRVDAGPTSSLTQYTLKKGADSVWRAEKIQGVGTC